MIGCEALEPVAHTASHVTEGPLLRGMQIAGDLVRDRAHFYHFVGTNRWCLRWVHHAVVHQMLQLHHHYHHICK